MPIELSTRKSPLSERIKSHIAGEASKVQWLSGQSFDSGDWGLCLVIGWGVFFPIIILTFWSQFVYDYAPYILG